MMNGRTAVAVSVNISTIRFEILIMVRVRCEHDFGEQKHIPTLRALLHSGEHRLPACSSRQLAETIDFERSSLCETVAGKLPANAGWVAAASAPQKQMRTDRNLHLFLARPWQRVEIDVAAGQDDADAATAKIDLVLDDCGIRNGG